MGQPRALSTSIGIGGSGLGGMQDWSEAVAYVVEAERLGVGFCWAAEAWGRDAVTPLAYLAARTSQIRLGTRILQVSARTPVMAAMTALTMTAITEGRFVLGLGVSGPQVVEGLHGVPFRRPLGRLREYLDILDLASAGEKIRYEGQEYVLPLPGGEGKALRLAHPAGTKVPVYLATLSPRSLELTGERADGWVSTSFIPEAAEVYLEHIRRGAEQAGRTLDDIDLQAGGRVEFGDDVAALAAAAKGPLATRLGGMGSASTNFYNRAYRKLGYEEVAEDIQTLWVAGERQQAADRIPDEMVLAGTFLGTEDMVRDRLRAQRAAGVTTVHLEPAGSTLAERLETLGRALDLVRDVNAGPPASSA